MVLLRNGDRFHLFEEFEQEWVGGGGGGGEGAMKENAAQDGRIHICAAGDDHDIVDGEIWHHHNMNKT
jgi:hypothetical protein